MTSTSVLRGRRLRFAWQVWHLYSPGSGGALGLGLVAGDAAALCVAGVAFGDIHLRFTWQAWRFGDIYPRFFTWHPWHLWHWTGSGGVLGLGLVAGDAAALCVAGVALGDIYLRLTWQAWHLVIHLRFTWQAWHFDIYLRFAWQAWRLWHWAGSGGALGLGLVAGDAAALCVAGVAFGDIHLRFTWQAWRFGDIYPRFFTWHPWHLWHWTGSGGVLGLGLVAGDAAALCVAGVALGDIYLRLTWQAWHLVIHLRFTWQAWHFDIYLRFAWQAWHLWHWAGSGGALGLGLVAGDAAALCVAGVAQAWHLATSTFVSRGRRGT